MKTFKNLRHITEAEASPMIKPPKNEFGTKADAFAHAKKTGSGKVFKKSFTHPLSGQKHVSYVVKEDAEQIDELKRTTLANYISKAAGSYGRDKQNIGRESPDGTVAKARPELKRAVKNRLTGINRAAERLAKEEIEIHEAIKKPNATTRHLRQYPVSDKEMAKPVKKPEKKKPEQGVAEGTGKNVVKSVKVGNFRHDLVNTGMGWQVRIYNGDELHDTGMSKNSEQKGLAALEDAVAYTEKQTRTKRQGVAEGSGNWYIRVKGKVVKDKQFNAIPFPSKETATQKALEIHNKKRIPLDMIKLTQSWMDGPEQGVAEGDSGAKYRIKQIGKDNKGHYYISPSTGKKVYKQAKVGDHENPKTGEHMKKIKEDETMQFAAEVTPKVSPYAGIKDNKFRGAIGEESNYNPVGVQPGGWRKYKLKVNELKELGKDKKEKIAKFRKQIQDLKAKGFYKAADDVQKGFKTVFPDEKVVAETYEYLLYRYSDLLDKHDDMFVISTIISESKHKDKKDNAKKVIKKLENTSEGQIYSTGGGAGEAQRKYKPKLSGVFEGITTSKKSINK